MVLHIEHPFLIIAIAAWVMVVFCAAFPKD